MGYYVYDESLFLHNMLFYKSDDFDNIILFRREIYEKASV